ncbi:Stage II sporulation protein E (SpoIIE) [Rubripirellula amarantea]|uniref:Stage II sporulation protein E (SpoIIE) n=1 Tax=Rubripirellula amarantea TaxID=2527999 RepID=A0A5C5WWH0_9BACT|nr:SpoIIE family protein phosphatase [Rubripirellula amarantea]TWT55047.1 Stage II sporulation protein E (SpoIIE) [Rubripirellula amarantea]
MTASPPSFLRVHRGPETSSSEAKSASEFSHSDEQRIDQFWDRFAAATGWRLTPRARRVGESPELTAVVGSGPIDELKQINALESTAGLDSIDADAFDAFEDSFIESLRSSSALHDRASGAASSVIGKADATQLAASAIEVISELQAARGAIRRANAEMAARASVIASPEQQTTLAERIETILSDAVAACDCTAAIIYMLDDDTSVLSGRSVFGMSPRVIEKEPRPLQGSRGDLEAMIKGVVTIDDMNAGPIDTWNAPEKCEAAICAAICSGDVPIGTMWLLSDETKSFQNAQAASARMAARAIGVELTAAGVEDFASPVTQDTDLDLLKHQSADWDQADQYGPTEAELLELQAREDALVAKMLADRAELAEVAAWQIQTLPIGAAIAADWKADGMIDSPRDYAIGWHLWDVLPDGSLAFAIAEACEADVSGAMNATVARAAFASHLSYRHTPTQMLARVADTLWQTSLGEQWMSMLYASIDPETGEGIVASAGHITAIIGSQRGYRPIIGGRSIPLCMDIDPLCVQNTFRILPGEALLAYTQGFLGGDTNHSTLGEVLHKAMKKSKPNPLAEIRKAMASIPKLSEQGAASLVRS